MLAQNHSTHTQFLFKQGGARKLLRHVNENILFDLKNRIETSSWLDTPNFKEKPENLKHGVKYRASATSEVIRALNIVTKRLDTKDYGFFDMGCGKGKILCISGLQYQFSEQTGIDYYQPFIDTTEKNLQKCGVTGTKLHYMDMTTFTDFTQKSVIYMYNPADEFILEKVRNNIERFTEDAILIYNKPLHAHIFDDWDIISEKQDPDPDHCTTIFRFQKK